MYLNTTKSRGIVYKKTGEIKINTYTDADFAADTKTARSTSGIIVCIGKSAVAWKSKLQSCVTLSTAEAELVAATEAAQMRMGISNLLQEIGIEKKQEITLYEDNNSCIAIATKPNRKNRIRHMEAK